MQRFFVPSSFFDSDEITFTQPLAHQLGHVLRLAPGDRLIILDGNLRAAEVSLTHFTRDKVLGQIIRRFPASGEPDLQINLYQCLIKGPRFDFLLEKAVELGVKSIIPTISSRTINRGGEGHQEKGRGSEKEEESTKETRWKKIVREAAEQARRGRLPEVTKVRMLKDVFREAAGEGKNLNLLCWEEEESLNLKTVLPGEGEKWPETINLFIGPEGGFTKEEVQTARDYGIIIVTLGSRIMRAETAGIAVLAALMYAGSEWNRRENE